MIISSDGYIVTNNHVVDDAVDVQIILDDNRKFTAKVIGRDPNTDIITDVNKISVSSMEAIERVIRQSNNKKPIFIEGIYPNGEYSYYVIKPIG